MSTEYPREEIEVSISAYDWEKCKGDFQSALIVALERETKSHWRIVCANILVECCEPYRTLVLQNEMLENLRAQQHLYKQQQKEVALFVCPEIFQVKAELHTPLIADEQARNIFELSAQYRAEC